MEQRVVHLRINLLTSEPVGNSGEPGIIMGLVACASHLMCFILFSDIGQIFFSLNRFE